MLADPIEGFLAGINSGPARLFTVGVATLLGFAICVLPVESYSRAIFELAPLAFFAIFWWAKFGVWFVVGLSALIGLFAFIHAFLMERSPKFSLFAVFTCAAIYIAPITSFDNSARKGAWLWSIVIYLGAAAAYWMLPSIVTRFLQRHG